MQSGSLRMLEKMSDPTKAQEQIIELSRKIEEQNKIIEEQNQIIREQKTIIDKLKETPHIKSQGNKMSIIIENYKKSLIVKNLYQDKYTTQPFKDKFKELGGKWTKNNQFTGWLFLGKYDSNKTIEECAQFILDYFDNDIDEHQFMQKEN